jgi:NRAMP (natural resistance-associated macrophage protein)-like metal ion transporter
VLLQLSSHFELHGSSEYSLTATPRARRSLVRLLSKLGPGLVTGAADDDPSGVGTYSIAGAQFGYACLWSAWFTFPLMAAIQLICAQIGIVSGRGLAALLRERYGVWALWPACGLLAIANIVNMGADLGAMAASTAMITGIPSYYFTPIYTLLIVAAMAWTSYRYIAKVFKWMTLVLFAYIFTAFLAHPDWNRVLHATFIPHIQWSGAYMATLVAVLGTTISPYLFFWQTMQEVEEQRDRGKAARRRNFTRQEQSDSRFDVITGMLLSNVIMYFIILTTGATLHAHGQTHIVTTQQAGEALRPLAGKAAYLLFTLGIVGTGMLSVPVLAGSTAYAIAEAGRWRSSLRDPPRCAPQFYAVLGIGLLIALGLNYIGLGVVAMLFWSAVINGILAPPLIVLVVLLCADPVVMGRHVSSRLLRTLGWVTAGAMTLAAVGMFLT